MRFAPNQDLNGATVALYASFFLRFLRANQMTLDEDRVINIIQRCDSLSAVLSALRTEATLDRPISYWRHPIKWLSRWLARLAGRGRNEGHVAP